MKSLSQITVLCFLMLGGCGSWLPEMVPFGAVTAPDYNRSLNGLGLHRKMWESAGAKCLAPQKLSPKLDTMDVIVLVGQTFEPPGLQARQWLEDWLARESGRTVIYFGRDFNADIYYRRKTLTQLPVEEQARGEQFLALHEAGELNLRWRQLPESTFCRWFFLDTNHRSTEYRSFAGVWAENFDATRDDSWPVGVALQPPDQERWQNKKPSWLTNPPANTTAQALANSVTPVENGADDAAVRRSDWEPQELDSVERWDAEISRAPTAEVLLAGEDGQALVFRLTSKRFAKSQILIVANGAPLLNGSLVEPLQQQIGKQIIESCLPAERVALLAYGQNGLLITSAAEKDARAAGLEMLTVWPLSGITMPAALFGIIVCAALLPILGRPQSLVRRSVSDFGLHVEAIGRMMYEARDIVHAKSVIEAYFLKVRSESPPSWLEDLAMPQSPAPASASPAPVQNSGTPVDGPSIASGPPIQSEFTTHPHPPSTVDPPSSKP